MNDRDFMRYSRQILLDDIALDGQQKLLDSQVLIIGLGGLGTPAALYLAGAGVGTLVLADDDDVHLSNLQRQILFTTEDIDRPKSQVSHQRLTQLNPDIQLTALQQRLTGEALKDAVARADVVLDCTDNMATRQEINTACVALNTPLITASAVGFGGQLMVLTPPWEQGCYRCLWPDNQDPERNCRTAGVVGPVVGVMGTLQALEAIKLLSGIETPAGELRLFDGKSSQWRSLALRRATVLPGMRRKQCRSCLTIKRCSAPPGKRFTNYWSNSTNDKRARLWRLISKSSRVSSGRNISCRMATRSCFFRLLLGVEMLRIADKTFDSHLFTGTGKFASSQLMVESIRASGSQLVTLAMKRVDLRQHNDAILEPLIAAGVTLLPNTSGAKTAEEAIFAAHLAREALGTNWLKLEIHPDARWLLPDPIETLKAAETLVQQGFVVLPYCGADPVLCKRLEEVGCAAVMPLGAPIGSNQGLETRAMLEIIIQQATVPVVVDAGIGVPSHAAQALEMGADAVLVNTAIAIADDPVNMAKAFRLAVEAGLLARQSGPGSRSHFAHATSPLTGFLEASA